MSEDIVMEAGIKYRVTTFTGEVFTGTYNGTWPGSSGDGRSFLDSECCHAVLDAGWELIHFGNQREPACPAVAPLGGKRDGAGVVRIQRTRNHCSPDPILPNIPAHKRHYVRFRRLGMPRIARVRNPTPPSYRVGFFRKSATSCRKRESENIRKM